MPAPLTTVTLFRFPSRARAWAFVQMGLARRDLERQAGLAFWKLVGSGHGRGFSLRPDWSQYGIVATWSEDRAADAFFDGAPGYARFRDRADEAWTLRMRAVGAHGAWSGTNPFLPLRPKTESGPVAVITRATLRWRRLAAFWGAVPSTSRALERARGLVASVGIGEVPYLRQATFSLWRDEPALRAFAYEDPLHREVIRRTRDEGWYEEELFARFVPEGERGTWHGRRPLAEALAAV